MPELNYYKKIGAYISKRYREAGYTAETYARKLTVQCIKNMPIEDRDYFIMQDDFEREGDKLINSDDVIPDSLIEDYINNLHKLGGNVFLYKGNERSMPYFVTASMLNNYTSGKTPIPTIVLVSISQLLNMSVDDFILEAGGIVSPVRLDMPSESSDILPEELFGLFFRHAFGNRSDNRYVFDTTQQAHLLSSLFTNGKDEEKLHFVYLPIRLDLKDPADQKPVIYQRGILTFEKRDGICHVTSKLRVSSQGVPTEYRGFGVIMNPHSTGPTCTCFLREENNDFGIFILFSFRLSPLEKNPKRKIRISECMSVRKTDGTSYMYRLLLSENYIDDCYMKYFTRHLKLATSENTNDGYETSILVKETIFNAMNKYLRGESPVDEEEIALFADLSEHLNDEVNRDEILVMLKEINDSSDRTVQSIRSINPLAFRDRSKSLFLLLGWLGKYGLSARHDKIVNAVDDEAEYVHKNLFPELYINSKSRIIPHF